jgi:hypothetical protein
MNANFLSDTFRGTFLNHKIFFYIDCVLYFLCKNNMLLFYQIFCSAKIEAHGAVCVSTKQPN